MSLDGSSRLFTTEMLEREVQFDRCDAAVREYFSGKQIHVDYAELYTKLTPYPLYFQFAHLISFLKYDWKDALRWCLDHRGEILKHEVDSQNAKHKINTLN